MDAVLAIDMGGTNTRVVTYDTHGKEVDRAVIETDGTDFAESLYQIHKVGVQLAGDNSLQAAGIAIAGNLQDDILIGSGNLPGWHGKNIKSCFESMFDVPCAALNDCAAAALGEYSRFGRDMVYVIWGTGVGAAVVTTANGHAGIKATELGHMIIDPGSCVRCGCGKYGHLEALICKSGERRFGGRRIEEVTDKQWSEVLADLAAGLYNISCGELNTPIVLGGGAAIKQLSETGGNRLNELQCLVNNLASAATPAPSLHLARLGEDAGIVGASIAARRLAGA